MTSKPISKNFFVALLIASAFLGHSDDAAAQGSAPRATAQECRDFPTFPPEKTLPGGLARAIYSEVARNFQFKNEWKPHDFYYEELARYLNLPIETDLDRAKAQLQAANQKLVDDFYIAGFKWFKPSELSSIDRQAGRWQIRYYPGVRFTHNQLLTLWYEVISPDNSDVLAVLNNRSVIFDGSRQVTRERTNSEPALLKALNCARELGVPRDIIACLCNLGCFYYVGGEFRNSDKNFKEAVELARSTTPPNSPALAPLIDFEAMSARSLDDFPRAEKLYLETLQIRSLIDGYYKPDVAHSFMNLGSLYMDWSYAKEDPNLKLKDQMRAQDLFKRADEIMNPSRNASLSQELMNEAIKNHELAQTASYANAWKYKKRARDLAEESNSLRQNLVLVTSRERTDLVPNSEDLSHGLGRQFHPTMTVNQGQDKLAAMVDFAQSISKKCETPPPPPEQEELGLATILGNWSIPTDTVDVSVKKTMHRKEAALEGTLDVEETREEKKSPVENVSIYLCRYPENPNSILSQIQNYGMAKGLAWAGLGEFGTTHGWPANHLQAEQLQAIIDQAARSIAKRTTTTDKVGDFKFENVPKGDYMLYGSICTKKNCLVWLIPGQPIRVRRVNQFRYDFIESTGKKIWEEGHPSAPETPSEYFRNSSVEQQPNATPKTK